MTLRPLYVENSGIKMSTIMVKNSNGSARKSPSDMNSSRLRRPQCESLACTRDLAKRVVRYCSRRHDSKDSFRPPASEARATYSLGPRFGQFGGYSNREACIYLRNCKGDL